MDGEGMIYGELPGSSCYVATVVGFVQAKIPYFLIDPEVEALIRAELPAAKEDDMIGYIPQISPFSAIELSEFRFILVYVAPSSRRKKIATSLINNGLTIIRQTMAKVATIYLIVPSSDRRTIAVYVEERSSEAEQIHRALGLLRDQLDTREREILGLQRSVFALETAHDWIDKSIRMACMQGMATEKATSTLLSHEHSESMSITRGSQTSSSPRGNSPRANPNTRTKQYTAIYGGSRKTPRAGYPSMSGRGNPRMPKGSSISSVTAETHYTGTDSGDVTEIKLRNQKLQEALWNVRQELAQERGQRKILLERMKQGRMCHRDKILQEAANKQSGKTVGPLPRITRVLRDDTLHMASDETTNSQGDAESSAKVEDVVLENNRLRKELGHANERVRQLLEDREMLPQLEDGATEYDVVNGMSVLHILFCSNCTATILRRTRGGDLLQNAQSPKDPTKAAPRFNEEATACSFLCGLSCARFPTLRDAP
ncbi:hypothetical protein FOL47_005434 [Perkinsus chesapeaki]|uniref:N-acetyltransferase domain-containing protein n=1 Tax=Perkinsus chesapeaki TaxID=330153 RepID=A0A7J6MZE5_PERCH|nr:hypothetical protein FOL47_005434 [Perkinsus chesapeaki]